MSMMLSPRTLLRTTPLQALAVAALAFSFASARPAAAQSLTVGGDVVFAKPYGEFGQNVRQGWGFAGYGLLGSKNTNNPLGLRLDVNYLNYGNTSALRWFDSFFGSYAIDQKTTNNILVFGIGPQLTVRSGPVRPYINFMGGLSHYYTETSLEGYDSDRFESKRTEQSNWKLSYGGGGGFLIPISVGAMPVSIDVGAQYRVSGRTTYLTRDDIHPDEDTGRITVTPRTTDVRYITYRLGVSVAF